MRSFHLFTFQRFDLRVTRRGVVCVCVGGVTQWPAFPSDLHLESWRSIVFGYNTHPIQHTKKALSIE